MVSSSRTQTLVSARQRVRPWPMKLARAWLLQYSADLCRRVTVNPGWKTICHIALEDDYVSTEAKFRQFLLSVLFDQVCVDEVIDRLDRESDERALEEEDTIRMTRPEVWT